MLDPSVVHDTLQVGLAGGGQFAEVFVEDARSTTAVLDDGRIEDLVTGRDRGAGIRLLTGDRATYAYTNVLTEDALVDAARAAGAGAAS